MSALSSSLDRAMRDACGNAVDELSETARLARDEDPRWRLVMPVTLGTRQFIIDQMPALLLTYGVAVALILTAASMEDTVPLPMLVAWLFESAASIAARYLIFRRVITASPVNVARRVALRLSPVFAILLAALHWG